MKAKLVSESLNVVLDFSDKEYDMMYKKLEYTFKKKSGNPLVDKIKNGEVLSDIDLTLLIKKFEYTFRKSNPDIIQRIKKYLGIEELSNVKYSNLKAKKKQDLKTKENKLNNS